MEKRFQIGLAVFVVGLTTLTMITWQVFHRREPIYQGRALRVWLQTYDPSGPYGRGSQKWQKTDEAVRQIGAESLPVLLSMLRAADSGLKLRLIVFAQKQRVVKIHFVPAAARNTEASRAFLALGDRGQGAVPELLRIYNENNSVESVSAVEEALGWIGPAAKPAIPLLLGAATNSNSKVKASALWALGEIRSEPRLCVPELIRGLDDTNTWTQISAAHALGMFGADAQAAVPALTKLAGSTNFGGPRLTTRLQLRLEARKALDEINADATSPSNLTESELGLLPALPSSSPP